MHWKSIVTELLWFLRGETNIKYLVDNDCHIWDGDCYKAYVKKHKHAIRTEGDRSEISIQILEKQLIYPKEEFINKIKTDDEFAKKWGDLGPIYGKQWRSWQDDFGPNKLPLFWPNNKIDQIQNLINELKTNPDSRRLMVSAWNVGELDSMTLPPCHYGFQVYTRELSVKERLSYFEEFFDCTSNSENMNEHEIHIELSKSNIPTRAISLMCNARSQDVPLGTPFNLASYGLLLTIIAKEVGMVPYELISNMGDCHIYLNQIDGVKDQLTRKPYSLPQMLGKDEYHYLMDLDIPFSQKIEQFKPDFWKLENYQSHPSIKMPLSN
jgi:thymidylate synthase